MNKLLELINEFSKVKGDKVGTQTSCTFCLGIEPRILMPLNYISSPLFFVILTWCLIKLFSCLGWA